MVKPPERMPENVVLFKTDPRMTDWDIKNYLEKIYKVSVAGINSRIFMGDLKASTKGLTKKDDYKLAHITLTSGQTFKWPELFPEQKAREQKEDFDRTVDEINKGRTSNPDQIGVPTWFA